MPSKDTVLPIALSFDDILLVPKRSTIKSRSDVDLFTQISPRLKLKIPLISTNMDTVTGIEMAIKMGELGGMGVLPRFESIDSQAEKVAKVSKAGVVTAASVGIKKEGLKRAGVLVKAGARVLDVDVAHGHMQQTAEFTQKLKEKFGSKITILSGIAATGECADELFTAGADCVTVGVGGGSICSTRVETGCGVPTFTSLLDIKKVAKKHKKTFIPLAGIKNSGDIVKSLAAGASAIRAGNLFAGTDEAPGEILEINYKKYKRYSGSTSFEEKSKHLNNGHKRGGKYIVHIEGIEGLVPYKGPIEYTIAKILAGVRSGFSYCGASNIKELWKNAKFIQTTSAGRQESLAHSIRFSEFN